jgi:NitT/TauT family transport system substrate-binding protein
MRLINLFQNKLSILVIIFSIGLGTLVLTGCGSTNNSASTNPAPKTDVNVQLAWVHTMEYSGFYMAQDKGYYEAENLNVELHELGSDSPIDLVASGKADFGITSADLLLLARAEGKPVVAIGTIYQRSPVAFISLAEKNITRPQDLIGAKVMVHFDGTTGIVYRAMLAEVGIDPEQVNSLPRKDFTNNALFNGEADVIDAYIVNQPVHLAQEGHETNAILASDYGVDVYANVIFTSEEMIANKPDIIEGFLRATVRGMQSAIDDPEAAAKSATTRDPELDLEAETASMQRSLPLLNPAGSQPGLMQAQNWERMEQILLDQDILSEPIKIESAYNLTFLENVYDKLAKQ